MVAVWAAGMGHNRDIVRRGLSSDLDQLSHSSHPHHVRLENVDVAALDKLSESVLGVFMLVFRDQQVDDGSETVRTSPVVNLS